MMIALWLLMGLLLGGGFIVLVRAVAMREGLFFAVGLFVVAIIYVGFASAFGGAGWLPVELLGVAVYGSFGVLGMFRSPWWLVAGWAAHPVWDVVLHYFGGGAAFTPVAYSVSCISFDLLVAAYIAVRMKAWTSQPGGSAAA